MLLHIKTVDSQDVIRNYSMYLEDIRRRKSIGDAVEDLTYSVLMDIWEHHGISDVDDIEISCVDRGQRRVIRPFCLN